MAPCSFNFSYSPASPWSIHAHKSFGRVRVRCRYRQEQRCALDRNFIETVTAATENVRERESINFHKSLNVDHRKRSNNLIHGPVKSLELVCTYYYYQPFYWNRCYILDLWGTWRRYISTWNYDANQKSHSLIKTIWLNSNYFSLNVIRNHFQKLWYTNLDDEWKIKK